MFGSDVEYRSMRRVIRWSLFSMAAGKQEGMLYITLDAGEIGAGFELMWLVREVSNQMFFVSTVSLLDRA